MSSIRRKRRYALSSRSTPTGGSTTPQSSSYITLEHLAKMTREGVDFKVLDAKTGD